MVNVILAICLRPVVDAKDEVLVKLKGLGTICYALQKYARD